MTANLIGQEGPLTGLVISFEEEGEKILGRDPEAASIVLEDPMVSRAHVRFWKEDRGWMLENLSTVNPVLHNGSPLMESALLKDGDLLQIGNTLFRFSEKLEQPSTEEKTTLPSGESREQQEEEELTLARFLPAQTRWFLRVVSGANAGAEWNLNPSTSYILGKDPQLCDLVFQDLTVSKQHAQLTVDEKERVWIQDLGSRNGTRVNNYLAGEKQMLQSQDIVSLGTTQIAIIDRYKAEETVISALPWSEKEESAEEEVVEKGPLEKNWKNIFIPKKHLILAGVFFVVIVSACAALFSLFKTQTIVITEKDPSAQIKEIIKEHPDIQFTFNPADKTLFLVGHVITTIDKQELLYLLKSSPLIEHIEDNVIIDELVAQNINDLLSSNPDWQNIAIYPVAPGRFEVRGYVKTLAQAEELSEELNRNFPYLDRLEHKEVVESNLIAEMQVLLIEKELTAVTFQLSNGELVLQGAVEEREQGTLEKVLDQMKATSGIRSVKNYVISSSLESARTDLSNQYQVTGFSKTDNEEIYVLIDGKILGLGDLLDGMLITAIQPEVIFLEKGRLKFKINYNLQ
jgi:type III secretion system YscD/HrpQ family protein